MKTLIAGVGNIFLGDDGFGCEVVRRLGEYPLPEGVDLVDFGIRGVDLSYALREGYDLAILVDTVRRGGAGGSLYLIELEASGGAADSVWLPLHDMAPDRVLQLVDSVAEGGPRLLLVACEPEFLGGDEGYLGLSEAAASAIDPAVDEVLGLLAQFHGGGVVGAAGAERFFPAAGNV